MLFLPDGFLGGRNQVKCYVYFYILESRENISYNISMIHVYFGKPVIHTVNFSFLYIYLLLAVLGLRCCAQVLFSGSEQRLLFIVVLKPVSPALAGGFLTIEPPGKSLIQ